MSETVCRGSRQFDGKTQTILVRGVTANIPIGGVLDCEFGKWSSWGAYQVLQADECTGEYSLYCDQDGPNGAYLGPTHYKDKYQHFDPIFRPFPEPRLRQPAYFTTKIELIVTDDWVKSC